MEMEREKLNGIDNYWRKNGFRTRSEFVRFACSSVMDAHDDDSMVLVQEKYFQWLMNTVKEGVATDIARGMGLDTGKIREELFNSVYQSTLKKLIEDEQICGNPEVTAPL
jgi:predicted DsbA family dithiol-disulfide isomerase